MLRIIYQPSRDYINGFSDDVKEILDNFEIGTIIDKLKKAGLLYLVVQKFAEINLSTDIVDNLYPVSNAFRYKKA